MSGNVKDLMTSDPACATPDTSIEDVAKLMVEYDCGEIPIIENEASRRPVGVITDRDITCRTVAKGLNPLEMQAGDCMTNSPVCVTPDTTLDECYQLMESNQIRRVPVVDGDGSCVGIVALADIALNASRADSAELLRDVSADSSSTSAAA